MREKELNESFGTLSETINGLAKLGYTHDFNIKEECIVCHTANITLSPDDFEIDHVYRFEGDSDPEYQSILYAISSAKFNIKGTLVNGYGISSDETTTKLIEKLEMPHVQNSMKNKPNDSTVNPSDVSILDNPLMEIDLQALIKHAKNEASWADKGQHSAILFKSDTMRIMLMGLHKNAELKPHKANGVISVQVLEGGIEFTAGNQSVQLSKGQMITLRDNVMHSVKAATDSFFLLTVVV